LCRQARLLESGSSGKPTLRTKQRTNGPISQKLVAHGQTKDAILALFSADEYQNIGVSERPRVR
jgi:hypothetical protein